MASEIIQSHSLTAFHVELYQWLRISKYLSFGLEIVAFCAGSVLEPDIAIRVHGARRGELLLRHRFAVVAYGARQCGSRARGAHGRLVECQTSRNFWQRTTLAAPRLEVYASCESRRRLQEYLNDSPFGMRVSSACFDPRVQVPNRLARLQKGNDLWAEFHRSFQAGMQRPVHLLFKKSQHYL